MGRAAATMDDFKSNRARCMLRSLSTAVRVQMKKSGGNVVVVGKKTENAQAKGPIHLRESGEFWIKYHVKPGARMSQITDIGDEFIGLQIAAPPRDGEANEEVVRWTAEFLGIRPRQVSLLSGHKSRDKVVSIQAEGKYTSIDQIFDLINKNKAT